MSRIPYDRDAEAARSNWRSVEAGDEVWVIPAADAAGTIEIDDVRYGGVIGDDPEAPGQLLVALTNTAGLPERGSFARTHLRLAQNDLERQHDQLTRSAPQRALLQRVARFLHAMGGGPIRARLDTEFELLKRDLAVYLSSEAATPAAREEE